MSHNFASTKNFLDPELTSDGKPYSQERFKDIVQERYLIAKNANISYSDTGSMTPTERHLILKFILEQSQAEKKEIEEKFSNLKR